jgi:hypothetical protein
MMLADQTRRLPDHPRRQQHAGRQVRRAIPNEMVLARRRRNRRGALCATEPASPPPQTAWQWSEDPPNRRPRRTRNPHHRRDFRSQLGREPPESRLDPAAVRPRAPRASFIHALNLGDHAVRGPLAIPRAVERPHRGLDAPRRPRRRMGPRVNLRRPQIGSRAIPLTLRERCRSSPLRPPHSLVGLVRSTRRHGPGRRSRPFTRGRPGHRGRRRAPDVGEQARHHARCRRSETGQSRSPCVFTEGPDVLIEVVE